MMKHRLALVLLTAAFFTASCGGGNNPLPTSRVDAGTGTVPLYQSSAELLTLPMLKVAGNIQTDVKLQVKKDGSWALLSSGSVRAATASDAPGAALAAPGSTLDLRSGQTDATLTVARLHVAGRVFANVALRLIGKTWAFVGTPQEVKTLHLEDFKSNTAIAADESHHVVLNSGPASGVQSVPMRLSTRRYKFCMDAQADGADSMTLLDADRRVVFALKAGEACATINAKAGRYRMEHRYGGTGKNRTVFMHHEENTTSVASDAARKQASFSAAVASVRSTKAVAALKASSGSSLVSLGPEYWMVRSPVTAGDDIGRQLYLLNSKINGDPCVGTLKFGFSDLRLAGREKLFRVQKDEFTGEPVALGATIDCTVSDFTYVTPAIPPQDNQDLVPAELYGRVQAFRVNPVENLFALYDSVCLAYVQMCNFVTLPFSLAVNNLSFNSFQLGANPTSDARIYESKFQVGLWPQPNTSFLVFTPFEDTAPDSIVDARYFPAGLAAPQLDVGQYALFANADCTGPAVVTSAEFTSAKYPLQDNPWSEFSGRFKSIQAGLSTRVVVTDGLDASKQFNQLSCTPISTSNSPDRQGIPNGFVIPPDAVSTYYPIFFAPVVDTIAIVIRTDSCELCNLAGADFTGIDLSGVKLRNANLANALMNNIDLSRADLRFTNLQGAVMSGSNLEGANLCAAQLNASAKVTVAASLSMAHMKNTNLTNAVLNGVDFSGASFYSSGQPASCQENSCDAYAAPTCAGATGASIENANFDSAYLANVDMGGATGRGVNFANATLFGVSFAGAKLGVNADAGTGSKFTKARLQGVNFANAEVSFADFTGAQMDLDSSCIQATLGAAFLQFPGSKVPASSGSSSCVAGKQAAPFCVKAIFPASPAYPATNCTNTCADGSRSGSQDPRNGSCSNTAACSSASWTSALSSGVVSGLPTSSCVGKAQLCNDFTNPANACW